MGSALLASVSVLMATKSTEACSCVDVARTQDQVAADFRSEYGRAVAVFVGRAISDHAYEAAFEVQQVWKGDLGKRVTLETGVKPANPDIITVNSDDLHFAAGKTYLVFAYGTKSRMKSQCCSPTYEIPSPPAVNALERLKSFATPSPPNPRMEPTRLTVRAIISPWPAADFER